MRKSHLGQPGKMRYTSSHDHLMTSCYYSIAYLGPSVTPYTYNNPAYRIYEMDGSQNSTFQLVDHHVYFFNLTSANSKNDTTWKYLYGAKVR